jgi:hypothetical protein
VHGAFQRRRYGECQYVDVLKHAAAALIAFRQHSWAAWMVEEMKKAGLLLQDLADVLRWFGLKTRLGQQEASQLCRFLYAWEVGICQERQQASTDD